LPTSEQEHTYLLLEGSLDLIDLGLRHAHPSQRSGVYSIHRRYSDDLGYVIPESSSHGLSAALIALSGGGGFPAFVAWL
jgi:hypothetical protein